MAWKRSPITFRQRAKAGFAGLTGPGPLVLGLVGTAASLTGLAVTGSVVWVLILSALAVLVLGVWVVRFMRTYRGHVIPKVFVDEMADETPYTWKRCTSDGLREACELTRPCLGADFVEFDVLEGWRQKCPEGFVELRNNEGTLCACFVILGLTDSFTEHFVAGRLKEQQIVADSILALDVAKTKDRVYLCGVVVRDHGAFTGSKRAWVLVWTMLQYVRETYGLLRPRRFFAVAATEESEKLMRKFAFALIGAASNREDGHNLYEIKLDEERWRSLLARVGNLSVMCKRSGDEHNMVAEKAHVGK
jgi:hypothetical protein